MLIVNLTPYPATLDQIDDGVRNLAPDEQEALRRAHKFNEFPSAEEISARAEFIANLAVNNGLGDGDPLSSFYEDPFPDAAMINGEPYLMSALERELAAIGIKPVYAFSIRESQEVELLDGEVETHTIFRHAGFIDAVLEDPRQTQGDDSSASPR